MDDFIYDINTKEKCWYLGVCDKTRCGEHFCIRHYKMSCLTHMAGMEGKLKYPISLLLDDDKIDKEPYTQLREIQSNISKFVSNGSNLLIHSVNCGTGKTEWAKKLMLSWFDSIWASTDLECRGLFISLPRLINALKDNMNKPNEYCQYICDNILTADLVVWDEINYKDYTEFEHEYLLNVINQRLAMGKSNIYTTNYDLATIEKKLGTRLSSRILGASIKIEFKGKDKRVLGVN